MIKFLFFVSVNVVCYYNDNVFVSVCCLLFIVYCLLFLVYCLLFLVSCFTLLVSCLLFLDS